MGGPGSQNYVYDVAHRETVELCVGKSKVIKVLGCSQQATVKATTLGIDLPPSFRFLNKCLRYGKGTLYLTEQPVFFVM